MCAYGTLVVFLCCFYPYYVPTAHWLFFYYVSTYIMYLRHTGRFFMLFLPILCTYGTLVVFLLCIYPYYVPTAHWTDFYFVSTHILYLRYRKQRDRLFKLLYI